MRTLIIAAITFATTTTFAAPSVRTWVNPECASGDCEVKSMKMFIENYSDKRMIGTQMSAEIETKNKTDLKKYAFVQYIQGCNFQTDRQGNVKMGMREFFGRQGVPFKHVGYELDSASDKDPIYWSNPMAGEDELRGFFIPRNSGYSYANPLLTDKWGSWAGKISNLKENKIFVDDMPTPSIWDLDSQSMKILAKNSSLKFKICLHKVEDVPERVEDPSTEIANPIVCMNWSSNFIYNFATRKFEDKKDEIHPACK